MSEERKIPLPCASCWAPTYSVTLLLPYISRPFLHTPPSIISPRQSHTSLSDSLIPSYHIGWRESVREKKTWQCMAKQTYLTWDAHLCTQLPLSILCELVFSMAKKASCPPKAGEEQNFQLLWVQPIHSLLNLFRKLIIWTICRALLFKMESSSVNIFYAWVSWSHNQ